jgi:hypothetical protein
MDPEDAGDGQPQARGQSVRKSITEILDTASGVTCVSEILPLFGAENK